MAMKKIVSGALAAMMALSISATAFAADTPTPVKPIAETTESSFQVELEGMIYTPTIRVQVSEAGQVYVNPSKSVVAGTMAKALDGTMPLDYSFDGHGVCSTPILIRSDTDKKLKVSAKVTATVPKTSGVVLADTVSTTGTDKKVKIQLAGTDNAGNSDALKTTTANDVTTPGLNDDKLGNPTNGSQGTKIVVADDGKSAKNAAAIEDVATIGAATLNKDATGKVTTAVPQYGAIVVVGDTDGKSDWKETDIVNVSVALSFAIDSTTV